VHNVISSYIRLTEAPYILKLFDVEHFTHQLLWNPQGLTTPPKHRPEFYCLLRHVLAVPNCSVRGIIMVEIKLSEFRLFSAMNRRLSIKRSDVWSESQCNKVNKGGKLKAVYAGIWQRLLSTKSCEAFFVCVESHTRNSLSAGTKTFTTKNACSNAFPKWKPRFT